jgi:hypothetical protein
MDAQANVTVETKGRQGREKFNDNKEGTGKQSMGRKIANDAINKESKGAMGASVYIADKIKVHINFNF